MSATLTVPHLQRKHIRRIFSKIEVSKETGCWLWTASLNSGGYGSTSVLNIRGPIHRLLYAWLVEPLPKGLSKDTPQIDHFVCSTRRCVNPVHLKLVSCRENALRGKGQSAIHAARTHCKNGHLLPEPANLYGEVRRRCKTCKRDQRQRELHRLAQRAYLERKKSRERHLTSHKKDGVRSEDKTNQGAI